MCNEIRVAVLVFAAELSLADKNCEKPTFDKIYQNECPFFGSVESINKVESVVEKLCLRTRVSAQFVLNLAHCIYLIIIPENADFTVAGLLVSGGFWDQNFEFIKNWERKLDHNTYVHLSDNRYVCRIFSVTPLILTEFRFKKPFANVV